MKYKKKSERKKKKVKYYYVILFKSKGINDYIEYRVTNWLFFWL
jgi:hypothetical protein